MSLSLAMIFIVIACSMSFVAGSWWGSTHTENKWLVKFDKEVEVAVKRITDRMTGRQS
jgi:hypothetical protein